jgi:hypothetical protein
MRSLAVGLWGARKKPAENELEAEECGTLAQQSGWPWQGPEQGAGYLVMPKEGKQQSEKRKNHRKTDRKKGNERIVLSSASPPIYPSSSGTQPWGSNGDCVVNRKKLLCCQLAACLPGVARVAVDDRLAGGYCISGARRKQRG